MERIAVEPLPRFDDFLRRWRAVIQENRGERESEWDSDQDRWLREVIERTEGGDGLAKLARATRCADDLRAWCHVLVAAKDWKAALAAHDEAAEIVADKAYSRGAFLDGAALAAGSSDAGIFPRVSGAHGEKRRACSDCVDGSARPRARRSYESGRHGLSRNAQRDPSAS